MASKYGVWILIFCFWWSAFAGSEENRKLHYGLNTLAGTIIEKVEYGPPNFENDGLCQPVRIRFIKLDNPIDIVGNQNDQFNQDDVINIGLIQVVEPSRKNLRFAIGKKAKIKGNLEEALTGHHYTRAVLMVENMADVKIGEK